MVKSIFLAILFSGIVNVTLCQEIAQWRGPNRDGIYPEKGLLKVWPENGPTLLWHYDELGDGHASATVTRDRVYTAGIEGKTGLIFCFTLDGKLLWKVPYGEEWTESWPGVRSTPLFENGKLYFISSFGKLICLNADKGETIWSVDVLTEYQGRNIQWGITENLLIDGEKLFCTVGGEENNIVALNKDTGKLIWSSKANGEKSAYCSPIVIQCKGKRVFITQTANSIIALDAANGALLWTHDQPNKYSVHANTPLFQEGYLFCSSGYGKGGVMLKISEDGSEKQELWRNSSMDNRMGGFVLLNGTIYGADDSNKAWWCLDWKTGKELFSEKVVQRGTTISADNMLYFYGDTGEMALVEPLPQGFKKVSSFKIPYGANQHWAHPVIVDGRLYVRHGTSLMVFEVKAK